MREKTLNLKLIEFLAILVIWLTIFSIPFFNNRVYNVVNWNLVGGEWVRIISYFLVFAINFYLLVPKILFKKRYMIYISSSIAVILIVVVSGTLLRYYLFPPNPIAMPSMNFGPGMPPMELGSEMPAPMGFKPNPLTEQKTIWMALLDSMIISLLVVGAGTAIKMISQWLDEESRRKDLEKEQLKTELALLRHQVSPHFFMNTLNNIHALVDINTETAKDTIIRLSTLMRYLLYETAHGHTSLGKEIEFIESYIVLMKLRFPKNVAVTVSLPTTHAEIQIPPMLFVSFLENAFKHGVSYKAASYVTFSMAIEEGKIICHIKNSKHVNKEKLDKSYSGIGLTNIKQSLKLLYGSDYTLNISDQPKEFDVELIIPILETNNGKR